MYTCHVAASEHCSWWTLNQAGHCSDIDAVLHVSDQREWSASLQDLTKIRHLVRSLTTQRHVSSLEHRYTKT